MDCPGVFSEKITAEILVYLQNEGKRPTDLFFLPNT
jgi:hypothetical protein